MNESAIGKARKMEAKLANDYALLPWSEFVPSVRKKHRTFPYTSLHIHSWLGQCLGAFDTITRTFGLVISVDKLDGAGPTDLGDHPRTSLIEYMRIARESVEESLTMFKGGRRPLHAPVTELADLESALTVVGTTWEPVLEQVQQLSSESGDSKTSGGTVRSIKGIGSVVDSVDDLRALASHEYGYVKFKKPADKAKQARCDRIKGLPETRAYLAKNPMRTLEFKTFRYERVIADCKRLQHIAESEAPRESGNGPKWAESELREAMEDCWRQLESLRADFDKEPTGENIRNRIFQAWVKWITLQALSDPSVNVVAAANWDRLAADQAMTTKLTLIERLQEEVHRQCPFELKDQDLTEYETNKNLWIKEARSLIVPFLRGKGEQQC